LQSTSSSSAFSETRADAEFAGVFALLDFLMGSSIDEVTHRHRLVSRIHTEAVIRAVLLRHGYDVERPIVP
jgi:hypothetical protein